MAAKKKKKKVKKILKRKKAVKNGTKSKPLKSKEKNPKVVSFAKRKEFSSVDVVSGSVNIAVKYFGVLAMIIGIPVFIYAYKDIVSVSAEALGNTVPLWVVISGGISNLLIGFLWIGALLVIAKKESGEEIRSVNEYLDIIFKQAVLRVPRLLLVWLIFVGVAVALMLPVFLLMTIKVHILAFVYGVGIFFYGIYLSTKYSQAFTAAVLTPKYSKLFQFSANITEGKILNIIIANFLIALVILVPALALFGVTYLTAKYGASIMPGVVLAIITACLTIIINITSTAFQYNIFMTLRSVYCDEDERI